MSADHVYSLDYNDVLATHRSSDAECTVVTTRCSLDEASAHAVVRSRKDGTIIGFDYKPDKPTTGVVAAEIFVYRPDVLVRALEELVARTEDEADDDSDTGLGDFGEHLLPWFVRRGKTVAHEMAGYWIDAGRPETYLRAHRDLLDGTIELDNPGWPILTHQPQRAAARIADGSVIVDSMVSNGGHIHGTVRRSVIGPGVVVERGATVTDSVVFANTRISSGARVHWAIVDEDVVVGAGATVGGRPRVRPVPTEKITIVGKGARVAKKANVALGERLSVSSVRGR